MRVIHSTNPSLDVVWDDVELNAFGALVSDLELRTSGREGKKKLVTHFLRERDRQVIEMKKRATLKASGRLSCEICSFDFQFVYGSRGREFCEVHHVHPLSGLESESETRLDDLAVVCSNCHRMLHRDPWVTMEQLKRLLEDERLANIGQ